MAWRPDYVSLAEAKAWVRVTTTTEDDMLLLAIGSASRDVDMHTHRQFGKVDASESRVYKPRWSRTRGRWLVDIDDVRSSSGLTVTVDGVELTAGTGYTLEPRNAAAEGRPYETVVLASSVSVPCDEYSCQVTTDKFGWASVPSGTKMATLLQLARVRWRQNAPSGVSGSPQTGGEVRLLERLDVDAAIAARPYVRRWWAR